MRLEATRTGTKRRGRRRRGWSAAGPGGAEVIRLNRTGSGRSRATRAGGIGFTARRRSSGSFVSIIGRYLPLALRRFLVQPGALLSLFRDRGGRGPGAAAPRPTIRSTRRRRRCRDGTAPPTP